ncbi:MAG: hypothetical protein JWQ51_2772 [Tardiphaga sp.]|nr:hypothetical protein [Tardiphaga sp.]
MTELTECGRWLKWPGGEHNFDLGSSRAIQILNGQMFGGMPIAFMTLGDGFLAGQFGSTPAACLKRFQQEVYSIRDVEHVLQCGLYGAGMAADDAVAVVKRAMVGKPLGPNAAIAYEVLAALFIGAVDASASA